METKLKTGTGKGSVWIRINGIGHAFSREIGCKCPRCSTVKWDMTNPSPKSKTIPLTEFDGWDNPPWRAHTSASLLVSNEKGTVSEHLLVDAGAGVGDSLVCSRLKGIENVIGILLTHWHPDHTLGLNQIVESLKRTKERRRKAYNKIPLYCTLDTYDMLRKRGLSHGLRFHEILPRVPFVVRASQKSVPINITPLNVTHGKKLKGAVIYVVKVKNTKTIFCWDVDVPSAGDPSNIKIFEENKLLFKGAKLLLLEANTWKKTNIKKVGKKKEEPTGHTSYQAAKAYISLIQAKKTLLMHLSGHEDGKGKKGYGWTDQDWDNHVSPDGIGVARQGKLIHL